VQDGDQNISHQKRNENPKEQSATEQVENIFHDLRSLFNPLLTWA
jgi:hypothetical protein